MYWLLPMGGGIGDIVLYCIAFQTAFQPALQLFSPIRLAYKGFLLYPKAMGGPSRGGAGPGSPGNPPRPGSPSLLSLVPPAPNPQNSSKCFGVVSCPKIALAFLVANTKCLSILSWQTMFSECQTCFWKCHAKHSNTKQCKAMHSKAMQSNAK